MTTPTGLELVWANAGGTTDPGDSKYQLGWVAEIPTFQNFNFVLQNLDKAKLSYAEGDIYPWQGSIAYKAGARVERKGKTFYCVTPHNDSGNTDPQDPNLDVNGSYWVSGTVFSSVVDAFTNLNMRDGVKIDQVNPRGDKTLWGGNDVTVHNGNAIIALNTPTPSDSNLLFGNVNGKIVVVNVGTKTVADGTTSLLPSVNPDAHEIYHEGNKPKQADVEGTIPANPADGVLYGRRNGNWVKVTAIDVQTTPPPPVAGNGSGWYNLEDGTFYVDINDGDSSQWVPASPPTVGEALINDLSQAYEVSTLEGDPDSLLLDVTVFPLNKVINVKERSTGNAGGGKWVKVLTSAVTPNGYDIVQSVSVPTQSFELVQNSKTVIANKFGVIANGTADDLAALQFVLDKYKGFEVVVFGSRFAISDTLYVPRGTTLKGAGSSDSWSGRTAGLTIVNIGAGTPRIWTDVNDPGYAQWYDLTDTPITVMVVTEGDSSLRDISVEGQAGNVWDVGILNPACKRVSHINVNTYGEFNITSYLIDATWSDRNDALIDLHTDTYGRAVNPDQGPSELYHENCYYAGGISGVVGKGTDRNPEDASNVNELVWAWGGASDINWHGVRFGNNSLVPEKRAHGYYCDWGYARDVSNKNGKYYQNQYFYGCSARAKNGRYAMLLDRCAYANVIGIYSEMSGGFVTLENTSTALADAELIVSPNVPASSTGRSYKIKLSGAEWDIRDTGWTIGATVTSSSGGSFRIRGIGYDTTRYIICRRDDLSGTVLNGDTLTQASGQTGKSPIAAMDRTQNMIFTGQSVPQTASPQLNTSGGKGGNFSELNAAGMTLSADEWGCHVDGAVNLYADGGNFNINATADVKLTSGSAVKLSGAVQVDLTCTASQVNFYANGTDRVRWTGLEFSSYNTADLGSAARRWDTIYALNGAINTSDEREKTALLTINDAETACAKELKGAMRKFKFKSAVDSKGDKARVHWGVGAQTLGDIFKSHGLQPDDYGMFCYDEWGDEFEDKLVTKETSTTPATYKSVQTAVAGSRYGIRYEELICFIIAGM